MYISDVFIYNNHLYLRFIKCDMKKYFYIICCICIAGCSGNQSSSSSATTESEIAPKAEKVAIRTISNGTPVYDFGQLEHIFNQNESKAYVINFWATWCKPCVEELPYFEKITETYNSEEVKVILVSLDFEKQFEKKLVPFMAERDLKSEVVILLDPDSNTWINSISEEWSGAIPATIIYNADKKEFKEGSYESFDELNEIIKTYL